MRLHTEPTVIATENATTKGSKGKELCGFVFRMVREQSPTLVIRRHAWMRQIHDNLFPGDFGVVYMEVCTFVHQILANVDTGGLSAGETSHCFK